MSAECIKNAYDLLGWLCGTISALSKPEQEELIKQYNPQKRTKVVENSFDWFCMKGAQKENDYEFLEESQIEIICKTVIDWMKTNSDRICILYLLTYVEAYFDFEKAFKHFLTDQLSERVTMNAWNFVALNSNYKEVKGILIPKFEPLWKKNYGHSSMELEISPFSLLEKYIWIPETVDGWKLLNIYIDDEYIRISKNKPLKIIASPGQKEVTFCYHCDENNKFFIDGYDEAACEELENKIENILESSVEEQAHILLFPEMIGTKKIVENVCGYLGENDNEYPMLIFLPTTEELISKEKNIYQNTLCVVDGNGEKLAEYHKQHSFCLEKKNKDTQNMNKYYEPIEEDKHISVFHVKGVGRIGVLICADVFSRELKKYLFEKLQINILLVMAFTSGIDSFFRALAPAQEAVCDVVWCNTCAAYENHSSDKPVVAYFSYGHKDQSMQAHPCCDENSKKCQSCMITIKIATAYEKAGCLDPCVF